MLVIATGRLVFTQFVHTEHPLNTALKKRNELMLVKTARTSIFKYRIINKLQAAPRQTRCWEFPL